MNSLTSKERVIKLLLDSNDHRLSPDDLVLSTPEAYDHCAIGKNTKVVVTPSNANTVGQRTIYYDRIALCDLTPGVDPRLPFPITLETSSADLLDEFNRRYCTQLTQDDIVVEDLPKDFDDCRVFCLKANATSYLYNGCVQLRLIKRVVNLPWAVTTRSLPGLCATDGLTLKPRGLDAVVTVQRLPGLTASL